MDNKIIEVGLCNEDEIKACENIMSKRLWSGKSVCLSLRPIDCPKLLCGGMACLAGTVIETNDTKVEFPCSTCSKPTQEEIIANREKFINGIKGHSAK